MNQAAGMRILKEVSRSFYLSLRLLPREMREAAVLAYLLARSSDTVADCGASDADSRLAALSSFADRLAGAAAWDGWPEGFVAAVPDDAERRLLNHAEDLFTWLQSTDEGQAGLIRDVLAIIISGQRMDLEKFVNADASRVVCLADEAELDDYTWRVAGSVGAFWTRLGVLTLGDRYGSVPADDLIAQGIAYGKGLQLVNILRDLPRDLEAGRCYLPVEDPADRDLLMLTHQRCVERASGLIRQGFEYADSLKSRRLRMASVLPAILAERTLELLRGVSWQDLSRRIKVTRTQVYGSMLQAMFH